MVLKYGFNVLTLMFLLWPIMSLIFSFWGNRHKLMDYNRHIHYTVDGNEQVNGLGIIIIHLVAYLTLYFVPTLEIASWEVVIIFIPLVTFLFASKMYHERFGAMLAQNRFSPTES